MNRFFGCKPLLVYPCFFWEGRFRIPPLCIIYVILVKLFSPVKKLLDLESCNLNIFKPCLVSHLNITGLCLVFRTSFFSSCSILVHFYESLPGHCKLPLPDSW